MTGGQTETGLDIVEAGNYFLGGSLLSGGDSLSGSSTCQISLSLCRPKTPTWFRFEVPIWPIHTTLKRALRQRGDFDGIAGFG